MGRELKSKIPKVDCNTTPLSELDWQVMMRDREALRTLKSKENADKARRAETTTIETGDQVLLQNKFPNNKLATNYEKEPYTVIERNGNAAIIENGEHGRKMRNTNQMKKFVKSEEEMNEETKHQISCPFKKTVRSLKFKIKQKKLSFRFKGRREPSEYQRDLKTTR